MDKVLQQLANEIALLKREVAKLKLTEVPAITPWTDWEPTVTQSGSVAATVTVARYTIIQNTVHLFTRLAVTGTGTAGNSVIIGGVPSAAEVSSFGGNAPSHGIGFIVDSGTATYVGALVAGTATAFVLVAHNQTSNIGVTPSFALASGDTIGILATYETG